MESCGPAGVRRVRRRHLCQSGNSLHREFAVEIGNSDLRQAARPCIAPSHLLLLRDAMTDNLVHRGLRPAVSKRRAFGTVVVTEFGARIPLDSVRSRRRCGRQIGGIASHGLVHSLLRSGRGHPTRPRCNKRPLDTLKRRYDHRSRAVFRWAEVSRNWARSPLRTSEKRTVVNSRFWPILLKNSVLRMRLTIAAQ
jgi:hypothetical protein